MRTKPQSKSRSNLIAIALAAYRPKARFFSQQLQSLVDQTHQDWICVITFDSPMREALANPSIKKFKRDKRFIWRQNPRQLGVVRNFERAMALALAYQPTAIAFCDQDDKWLPRKLQVSLDALRQKPPMSLVHCDAIVASSKQTYSFSNWEDLNPTPTLSSVRHLLVANTVAGAGALFDARLARIARRSPDLESVYHDRWVAFAAANHGGVHPIDEKLYIYRQHAGNVLGNARLRKEKRRTGALIRDVEQPFYVRVLRKAQRGVGWFNHRQFLASELRKHLPGESPSSSNVFLAVMFLWCAMEYLSKGRAGVPNAQIALRLFSFGTLSLFGRSRIQHALGISRQRSAPRRRL
jgi:hypothetical protein